MDRRAFVRILAGGGATALLPAAFPVRVRGAEPVGGHPDPRPGIDGSRVLGADEVRPDLSELFDGIRAIPHVADGIGCHCGCGAMPEMRSLLSCYEGVGMAQFCVICSGEGRLAVQLHGQGKSLSEIRAAIDRRFGA
jgi:hypothetical protein